MAIVTTFLESGTDATRDLTFYSATGGAVSSDTSQHNTGTRSLKLSTGAGPTNATANVNAVLADTGRRISFYYRIDALPTTNETASIALLNASNARVGNWGLQTTGKFLAGNTTGATTATGTTTLSANTWYHIEISYYVTNSTTFTFKMWINGVLDTTVNAGTLTNTTTTQIQFRRDNQAGANKAAWIDDVYIDDGASSASLTEVGDIRVTNKRPVANGTANGFTTQVGGGGSGYGTGHSPQVNEQPLNTTDGWSILETGSTVTEEYNIEDMATGDVDISAMSVVDYMGWVYIKSVAGENANMVINGVSKAITIPVNAITMLTAAAGSTSYPAASGTDLGVISSAGTTTITLYETGILFAYTAAVVAATVIGKNLMVTQAINRASTF